MVDDLCDKQNWPMTDKAQEMLQNYMYNNYDTDDCSYSTVCIF